MCCFALAIFLCRLGELRVAAVARRVVGQLTTQLYGVDPHIFKLVRVDLQSTFYIYIYVYVIVIYHMY